MGLRIIIGYPTKSKDGPFPVYVGNSGSEAIAARAANVSAHHFEILENPASYRKSNSNHQQPAPESGDESVTPSDAPSSLAEFGQKRPRR